LSSFFLMWYMVNTQINSFAHGYPVFPVLFVRNIVLSHWALASLWKVINVFVRIYFWLSYSIGPYVCLSVPYQLFVSLFV
jgi:hypothetical protein